MRSFVFGSLGGGCARGRRSAGRARIRSRGKESELVIRRTAPVVARGGPFVGLPCRASFTPIETPPASGSCGRRSENLVRPAWASFSGQLFGLAFRANFSGWPLGQFIRAQAGLLATGAPASVVRGLPY